MKRPLLTVHQYEAHAWNAVGAARLALGRGSINRWDERDRSAHGGLVTAVTTPFYWAAKFGLHVISRVASWTADTSNLAGIQRMATNAQTVGVGNCGEHAAVCFVHLMGRGAFPVDFVSFDDGSHAFVVVGFDPTTLKRNQFPTDPRNWNKEAIVADAWADKVGRADVLFPGRRIVSFCRIE